MAYVTDADGNWYWEDDGVSGVNTDSPQSSISSNNIDVGDAGNYNWGDNTSTTSGGYSVSDLIDSVLSTGALSSDSDMYSWVANYQSGSAAAAGRVSQLPSPVAAKDEGGSFFDTLKGSLGDAYKKDPLKFLQFGLQAAAGVYGAQQARELAEKKIQADKALVDQKYANEKDAQDRYTNSLRGAGAGRQKQPARKLTRIGGAQVFDANGNYIRS